MKNLIINATALLAALLSLAACDLDLEPENTYVDEKVYRNAKTAQAALAGCYVRLDVFLSGAPQDQNNYSNTGYTFMLGDLGTDNLKVRSTAGSFIAVEQASYSQNEHDGLLLSMWQWGYNAIDYANNIIRGINKYGRFDEATKQQYIAEAKFIRAYIYLQLLSMYGDQALLGNDAGYGVVLKLTPYDGYDPDHPSGRSTNAQCWAQIIDDLTSALPYLSTDVPSPSQRTRANRYVAQALLSRVYLYKGSYTGNRDELQLAAAYADSVLSQSAYTFATSPAEYRANLFPSNEYYDGAYPNPTTYSGELLFFEPSRLQTADFPNGLQGYYRKTSFSIPATALAAYDTADVRRTALIGVGSTTDNPLDLTSLKYDGGQYNDVIYFRLAELKLTRAETLARVAGNVTAEAVALLNEVHGRAFSATNRPAPYTVADFASLDDFLRAVLRERRLELAYEGQYRWDLMRTGNLLGDATLGAVPPARWNLPIPTHELRLTTGTITQNSGFADN